jgi:hypothetical protein
MRAMKQNLNSFMLWMIASSQEQYTRFMTFTDSKLRHKTRKYTALIRIEIAEWKLCPRLFRRLMIYKINSNDHYSFMQAVKYLKSHVGPQIYNFYFVNKFPLFVLLSVYTVLLFLDTSVLGVCYSVRA